MEPIVSKFLKRGKILSILLLFVLKPCFKVPERIILNATYYFTMKISKQRELHLNHLSDTEHKDFMNLIQKLYEKIT